PDVSIREASRRVGETRADDGAYARTSRRHTRSAHRCAGDGRSARRVLPERAYTRTADDGYRAGAGADRRREGAGAERNRGRAIVSPSTPPGPGSSGSLGTIAHYNLLEQLEPAGPGDLYRARDTAKGRTVAVRLLPADFTTGADSRAALIAQARAMTVLSHPNVTTLFDAGEHDGRVYLAFEFLKGQSLRAEMAGRPLKVSRAVEAAIQITDA